MLDTGFLITVYLINVHRFVVSPLVAGCGLLAGVGMMQHVAIVFVEIAVGTIPRAEIQRYHESPSRNLYYMYLKPVVAMVEV